MVIKITSKRRVPFFALWPATGIGGGLSGPTDRAADFPLVAKPVSPSVSLRG